MARTLDKMLPDVPYGRGVTKAISQVWAMIREEDLIVIPRSVAAKRIASHHDHAKRCLSYHPGAPRRRAYYGQDDTIMRRSVYETAARQVDELGLRTFGDLLVTTARRGSRNVWDYGPRRGWHISCQIDKHVSSDGTVCWVRRGARRIHGIRVRSCFLQGYPGWMIEGDGWTYHATTKDQRRAVWLAIQALRRQRAAEAKAEAKAMELQKRWVTVESLRTAGACASGIEQGARRCEKLLGLESGALDRPVAVRADVVEQVAPGWGLRAAIEAEATGE